MKLDQNGTVISFGALDSNKYPGGVDDASFTKKILCLGDSWFSLGALPSSNMLFPLRFAQSTLLYNLARPGLTVRRLSSPDFKPALAPLIAQKNFSHKWDCIFISAGGNDLIARADQIVCRPSVGAGAHLLDYVNRIELVRLKIDIQASFKRLAALREGKDNLNKTTWMVTHVYDYPTPRDAKAKLAFIDMSGPWLYPVMKQHDVPEEM